MCAIAASPSGARPRLVCRMTPVALISGRSECPSAWRSCPSIAPAIPARASCSAALSSNPEAISFRRRATTARAASVTGAIPWLVASASTPGIRRTSSTDGSSRNSSDFTTVFIFGLSHETYAAPASSPITPLQSVQIHEQILNVLRTQSLAVAGHFVAAEADDVGDALVVSGQSAQRKIFVLEYSLKPGALLAARGIRLMAAVAAVVVDSTAGGLLGAEAKFGVGLTALHVASEGRGEHQKTSQRFEQNSRTTATSELLRRFEVFPLHEPSLDRAIGGAASRLTMIEQIINCP